MTEPRPITERLADVQRQLRQRRSTAVVLHSAGMGALLVLLCGAFERIQPIRESTAFAVLASAAALSLLFFLISFARAILRQPSLLDIARAVENVYPELMDSLICAAEREALPESERRVLERALIAKVRRETSDLDVSTSVIPRSLQWSYLTVLAVAFAMFAVAALNSRVYAKARCHLADGLGTHPTGVTLTPGDTDVPVHTDVNVTARIERWEQEATIEFQSNGLIQTFPMNDREEGYDFTFYDLIEPVSYRVTTPSLATTWHTITVYTPPEILGFECELVPPAYTELAPRKLQSIESTSSVEGTAVTVRIKVAEGVSAAWETAGGAAEFASSETGQLVHSFELQDTQVWRIRLRDAAGHETVTAEITLEAVPDIPPVIDVLEPGKDVTIRPDGDAMTEARAADDFGLAEVSVSYSISGRARRSLTLYKQRTEERKMEDGTTEDGKGTLGDVTVHFPFRPKAIGAQSGDMISYYFTATDTKAPDPHTVRSEIFFIEIRPEIVPQDMEGSGKPPESVDIHALIAELKRLIRLSYDYPSAAEGRKEKLARNLKTGLTDLRTEAVRELDKLTQSVPPGASPDQIPVIQWFKKAIDEVERAEGLALKALVEEAIPYEERGLSYFVSVAQELAKNAAKGSEGEDKQESGDESKEKGEKPEETAEQESLQEKLDRMNELLHDINQLADRQGAQNGRTGRLLNASLNAAEKAELFENQEGIRSDTNEVKEKISRSRELERPYQELRKAGKAMSGASGAAEDGVMTTANREGKRAHSALLSAADMVRQEIRQMAANEIAEIARRAGQLSEAERSAAGASKNAADAAQKDKDAASEMRATQSDLADRTKELMDDARNTAMELAKDYPEAADLLSKALAEADEHNIDGRMKRAGNALLYQRYQRAYEYQTEAANYLEAFAGDVQDAAGALPKMSQEELLAALAELQRAQERMEQVARGKSSNGEQEVNETRQKSGQMLNQMGQELGDEALQDLSSALEFMPNEGSAGQRARQVLGVLQTASRVLQRYLAASELERKLRLSRKTTLPPEKYRSLVEQYFKSLSEGE